MIAARQRRTQQLVRFLVLQAQCMAVGAQRERWVVKRRAGGAREQRANPPKTIVG
jgi:hypothetical protein